MSQKIALLQGGLGAERDISLLTGEAFQGALVELNYEFVVIDAGDDLPGRLLQEKPDIALLALHGKYAEDGTVQGLCEYLKIPYTGSGVLASALCMNKYFSKQIFIQNQIPTPQFAVVNPKKEKSWNSLPGKFSFPVVVKPSREGSSVGVHIVGQEPEFTPAIEDAGQFDHVVLVEEFIDGMELTVPMLSGRSLTPIEIVPKAGFYDYQNKYTAGKTDYILPARLDASTEKKARAIAEKVYEVCEIRSYCRVDFRMNEKGDLFVIEVNTLPGCTATSLLPKSAAHDGISFPELIKSLLDSATLDYAGVK